MQINILGMIITRINTNKTIILLVIPTFSVNFDIRAAKIMPKALTVVKLTILQI